MARIELNVENGEITEHPDAPATPEHPNAAILRAIAAIESSITSRRVREAVIGADGGWLADADARIAALRSKLTK